MRLDDRPVIDQLTEPTPLNTLRDVEAHMNTLIDGAEYALGDAIYISLTERYSGFAKLLNVDDRASLDETHNELAGDLADQECARRTALIDLVVRELEARL